MLELLRRNPILLQQFILKIYYKILCFLRLMNILIQTNFVCYHVLYSRVYFYCVHQALQMCTKYSQNVCQFYMATRRGLYYSTKMVTSRKLTDVETLLPVSILFQFNEDQNMCIVNSEQRDCISYPNKHTHNIYIKLLFRPSEHLHSLWLRHAPNRWAGLGHNDMKIHYRRLQ